MTYLDRAAVSIPKVITDNYAQITGEGKQQKIKNREFNKIMSNSNV
jgi:hypothetical protein